MPSVTMREIAKKARVSVNTVSRALNDKPDISPETTKRIHLLAQEMGYSRPRRANVPRKSTRIRTIGVVMANISNPVFATIVRGYEEVLSVSGYQLLLCSSDENSDKERRIIETLLECNVDGILITPCQGSELDVGLLRARQVPIVFVARKLRDQNIDYIVADYQRGTYEAVEHLLRLGHRRILFLNGSDCSSSVVERLAGFQKAFEEHSVELDSNLVRTCQPKMESAYYAAKSILMEGLNFTAVTTFSDLMMLGVLRAIREAHLSVPEDISLVGFDNLDIVSILTPPLTTVRMPSYELGVEGARALLDRLHGKQSGRQQVLATELVVRESTTRAKIFPDTNQ